MCVDQLLELPQEAIDVDGDQLIYEFCAPLNDNGSATTIGAPSPYTPVPFILPTYGAFYPLGINVLTLDPITGVLSGNPPLLGQFLIGICVSEYRNGELLSTIRRDVQLNIILCDPLINLEIEADEIPGLFQVKLKVMDKFNCKDSIEKEIEWLPAPKVIIVSPDLSIGCDPLTTSFNNLSWPIDSTYEIEWDFGDGNEGSYDISPTYTFQDTLH